MPIMDGYEATALIRELEREKHLPKMWIVGLSAHSTGIYKKKAIEVGMDTFSKSDYELKSFL